MKSFVAAASALLLSACSLLLADDLQQEPGAGATATNEAGTSEDGAPPGPLPDGGTSDGGPSTGRRPTGPLTAAVNAQSITARVDEFFEIEFRADNGWKPTLLRDLGLPGETVIAQRFFEPIATRIEGKDVSNATDEDTGYVELFDETPVRLGFTTFAHHRLPSGADAKVWNNWTIYASGRVMVRTEVNNAGTAPLELPASWVHSSIAVDAERNWAFLDDNRGRSTTFQLQEPGGLGLFAFYLTDTPKRSSRAMNERHWLRPAEPIPPGEHVDEDLELQLGIIADEAAARTADLDRPSLGTLHDMTVVDEGIELRDSAYLLAAKPGAKTMSFELSPSEARFAPAVEIREFEGAGWTIELDGRVVTSSTTPTTAFGTSKLLPDRRLVFAYFGTIPREAPLAARTFTIIRP